MSDPTRILVIKLADIGDVLTATPALRALRQAYPQAMIDLLLTHHTRPVMEYSELVDDLIPSDNFRFFNPREALKPGLLKEGFDLLRRIRRPGYDTVLVLHHLTTLAGALKYATIAKVSGAKVIAGLDPGGIRGRFLTHACPDLGFGRKHEIDYWLAVVALLGDKPGQTGKPDKADIRAEADDREMILAVSEADLAWAELMVQISLPEVGSKAPLVIVHPGSGGYSLARRWSPVNFATVADALTELGAQILLVGMPTDGTEAVLAAMKTNPIDLTGQTTLHQLAALLQRANLFIGGDSGVTHLAAASGVPMVTIFGPTNVAAWGPVGAKRLTLQARIPCGPCAYVGHKVGLRMGCAARTCLKLITPAQVLTLAKRLLAREGDTDLEFENYDSMTGDIVSDAVTVDIEADKGTYQGQLDLPKVEILGVRVHAVTFDQTITLIERFIANKQPHQVVTVNPEFIVAARKDELFRRIINRAALAFPDGIGLLKAARWLDQPTLPERVAGVDIVEALAALSAQQGYRLYFLGAQPGVAEQAVAVLENRYPGMVVAGAFAGSPGAADEDHLVAKIQAAQPDIVFVAYGAPHQDKWIARNMYRLPASVLLGVGGAFDFISGATRRAPLWMQRAGLEWLHRFMQQPSRWRRIWNAVPRFLWLVGLERWKGHKGRKRG